MWGTTVNVIAIVLGTAIGCLLNKGIPRRVHRVIMQGLGLAVVVIGIMSAITTKQPLVMIVSLVIGGAIGRFIGIEDSLDALGQKIQKKFATKKHNKIAEGFVTATLIYCVGAMAILGSIESGLNQNYDILYVKSMLDGIASIVLAASLGWGVGLSAIPLLIFQGSITLGAGWIAPLMTDAIMTEISAVGGVLIMAIGINLLEIKKLPTGDFLPALLIPVVYFLITGLF